MGFLKDLDDTLGAITAPIGNVARQIKKDFSQNIEDMSPDKKTKNPENQVVIVVNNNKPNNKKRSKK